MLDIRDKRFLGQGMFAWLFLPLVALFNMFLHDGVIVPLVGPDAAGLVSSVVLVAMLFGTAYFLLIGVERPTNCKVSFLLGIIWVAFAIFFQALYLLFAVGGSLGDIWYALMRPAIFQGNISLMVLAMLFLAPAVCASRMLRD